MEATRVVWETLAEDAGVGRNGHVSTHARACVAGSARRALRTRIRCLQADLESVKRVLDHLPREAARAASDHIG